MFLFGRRKNKKEKRKIPKTVQQSIPIDRLYKDGVFKCGNTYSKTWRFSDINYAVASDDDQLSLFLAHSALINGLPTDAMAQITIFNRQLSKDVLSNLATPNGEKNYALYARELGEIFADKMADSNNIVHDKFITISSEKKNIEESRTFFTRVGNDLTADFAKLSSKTTELGYKDRLRIFYDFFRNGDMGEFEFDMKKAIAKGKHFKDKICPDSIEFKSDHIRLGEKYARVIFLKEYPSFLKDSMLSELTDFSRSMMLSVDIQPIPTDDAVKQVQKKLLAIETDITKWQQKQNMNNNFYANIPYEMEQMRKEIKETFTTLEEILLQTDAVKSIVTDVNFLELLAKAKTFLDELRQEPLIEDTLVNDFRNNIENAIVAIEACVGIVGNAKYADNLREFIDRAKRNLRIVNDRLKGWTD